MNDPYYLGVCIKEMRKEALREKRRDGTITATERTEGMRRWAVMMIFAFFVVCTMMFSGVF